MAGESSDFGASIAELQAVLLGTDSIDGFLQELAGLAEALGVLMRGSPALFLYAWGESWESAIFPPRGRAVSPQFPAGGWGMVDDGILRITRAASSPRLMLAGDIDEPSIPFLTAALAETADGSGRSMLILLAWTTADWRGCGSSPAWAAARPPSPAAGAASSSGPAP
jgi:hypothetical protein